MKSITADIPTTETTPSKTARRKFAWTVSLLIHSMLLVGLLFWYLPPAPDLSSARVRSGHQGNPNQAPSLVVSPPADQLQSNEIARAVEAQIEQASQLSDQERRSELEKQLKKLESISDSDSAQAAASSVASALGLDTSQYADKPVMVEGEFDPDSAQILEVYRTRDEQGRWQYETEMVDAAGRRMRVEVSAAEGQTLYETFEAMKRFPMAKGIYQSVVMPMLQKMLESPQ